MIQQWLKQWNMSYRSWICNNNLVGQDFCKWHFTQLCQGYRQFCLLTYAHSGFVPKTKILEETSRRSDEQTDWQTNWKQFQLVKIFANDTLPSYARATDNSVCLPMHIQSLCQRQKSWKKLQEDQMNRQTERLTNILSAILIVKIFANDTIPSYARATDISVCLPLHIKSLCQRQNLDEKLSDQDDPDRQTDRPKTKYWRKKIKTIRRKAWKNLEVKMNRRTHKVTHFASWHDKK